jgi:hypothetical protein
MAGLLDDEELEISCDDCGRVHKKTLGWLKRNHEIRCPCGTLLKLDTRELRSQMDKLDRDLREMGFE